MTEKLNYFITQVQKKLMTEFEESRLKFKFSDSWRILKLDDSSFYRKKFSSQIQEFKAIDFVGIHHQVLYLIEAKNFKRYRIENKKRIETGELIIEIAQKVRDSIACIIAATRTSETEKWQDYKNLLCNPQMPLKIVIWLEQDFPNNPREKARKATEVKEFKAKLNWLTSHIFVESLATYVLPDVTVENLSDPPNKSDAP